ncbi:MAG: gluconate 2-dehydrogenase subunit 3 family protein [Alphaproteobacteria bacterium]|nr:gluconate 2-dehydrogenase subunit 3 family protein [Alphaproteobacteria bacterium]
MNRREALSKVSLLLGGTIVGAELFLNGCGTNTSNDGNFFNADQMALLDEISETIIPKTSTPGAKDAQVAAFMNVYVRDCYTPDHQLVFIEGIKKVNETCQSCCKKSFLEASPEERLKCLNILDKEQEAFQKTLKTVKETETDLNPDLTPIPHYFRLMKELTIFGFFTSEIGATKALRYIEVPGKFDGSYPYKKGDRAWA